MATYPNTSYDLASRVTPRPSVETDTSDGGTIRGRSLYAAEVYDITLVHKYLTEAEADTLEAFYASNKGVSVDVTWRGDTYNAIFKGKPDTTPEGGGLWTVTSRLDGKRSDGG